MASKINLRSASTWFSLMVFFLLSDKNNTISPFPVTDKNMKTYFEQKKAHSAPETPVNNGGFVDMNDSTLDNETHLGWIDSACFQEESTTSTPKETEEDSRLPQDCQSLGNTCPQGDNSTGKAGKSAWEGDIDEILGCAKDYRWEVGTQDLPTTHDFVGTQALVDLQSKQPKEDGNSPPHDKN
jgi:hypothetical protein